MKLTKEDIQFIDTYLENSDVVFADIRMEMVDHVASEIEKQMEADDNRCFYEVFKDYMIENKAQLLNNNKQFLKAADKKIWKAIRVEFTKVMTLILFLGCYFVLYTLYQNFKIASFTFYISLIPLLALIGFLLSYIVYHNYKKLKRFSVVERLSLPYFCLYEITNILFNVSNSNQDQTEMLWLILGVSFALTCMLVLFKVSIKLFNAYDKQFNTVT